jgi:hypothetical protein
MLVGVVLLVVIVRVAMFALAMLRQPFGAGLP